MRNIRTPSYPDTDTYYVFLTYGYIALIFYMVLVPLYNFRKLRAASKVSAYPCKATSCASGQSCGPSSSRRSASR